MTTPTVRLRHRVVELKTGPFGSALSADEYVDDGVPLINPSDLSDGRIQSQSAVKVSEAVAVRMAAYRAQAGDLILARRGELGRYGLVSAAEAGVICGTGSLLVRTGNQLSAKFLGYFLETRQARDWLSLQSVGSTMENLSEAILTRLPIPNLDISKQEHIANFLDEKAARIDALIAEKEKLQVTLEEWREAELARICFGGESASEPTGNTWISTLPKGWRLVRLKHLVTDIEQGWSPECEARLAAEDEWGVLKAGASNGGVFRDAEHKALPSNLQPLPELEVKVGDVLVSRASGSADLVGSFAYVYDTRSRLMLSDKNFRLKFAEEAPLLPELLAWMCNTNALRQQVRQFVSGADGLAKNIGSGNLRELWLAVPPSFKQPSLVEQLRKLKSHIDQLQTHLEEHIARLREYRSSLISAAVTGQLGVDSLGCSELEAA